MLLREGNRGKHYAGNGLGLHVRGRWAPDGLQRFRGPWNHFDDWYGRDARLGVPDDVVGLLAQEHCPAKRRTCRVGSFRVVIPYRGTLCDLHSQPQRGFKRH